jgi:8-oxo-dGTP pyrophosphatase MutT (NUDIX family)
LPRRIAALFETARVFCAWSALAAPVFSIWTFRRQTSSSDFHRKGCRMATDAKAIRQSAVIALHSTQICLVLSTSGKRQVLPKGRIERLQTAGETALREAWEEAGLAGVLQKKPVGRYRYRKCGRRFQVKVFVLQVTQIAKKWPEMHRRQRCWLALARAAQQVREPALQRLLQRLAGTNVKAVAS